MINITVLKSTLIFKINQSMKPQTVFLEYLRLKIRCWNWTFYRVCDSAQLMSCQSPRPLVHLIAQVSTNPFQNFQQTYRQTFPRSHSDKWNCQTHSSGELDSNFKLFFLIICFSGTSSISSYIGNSYRQYSSSFTSTTSASKSR